MANFSNDVWMASTAAGFYPHTIDQSLRFEDGDSAMLDNSADPFASNGNLKTWTWSCWVKRAKLGAYQSLWSAGTNNNNRDYFGFDANDNLFWIEKIATVTKGQLVTVAKYRDVSAWYNVTVARNTDNVATADDRLKIYVNGVLQEESITNHVDNNHESMINRTTQHNIGSRRRDANDLFFDGYMADVVFVDGSALGPDSFGETKDGIWVPKDVSGLTFGQNGFHLDFADSSAIGNDVSGNDNDFAVSGLVASDVVLDSPTNNFATMNVLDKNSMTLSEGNLRCTPTGDYKAVRGNFAIPLTGKWFFEARVTTGGGGNVTDSQIGIATDQNVLSGSSPYPQTATYAVHYFLSGTIRRLGSAVQTGLASFAVGDVLGVAINSTDNEVQFYKNGSTVGSAVALPSTTKNSFAFFVGATSRSSVFNFGQDSTFAGAVSAGSATDGVGTFQSLPTDFKALCTANLDEPAIIDGSEYFNTVLYNGTSAENAITVGFQPDWCWLKDRDNSTNHVSYDSVRGATKTLRNDDPAAETTNAQKLKSFDSDGFTLGTDNNPNGSARGPFVAWNWKAGTAVSGNTTGSGTAKAYSGSVNAESGFSIITYKGNGTAGHTIPHNLGAKPSMVLFKNRDVGDQWAVYHKDILATHNLCLNNTDAKADQDNRFNDTEPTSSVMTLGTGHVVNATDEDYIAYFFTDIEGYCKAGSYTGNGSSDGTFIHTGFRPAWVMIKRTDATADWWALDNKRNSSNVVDLRLRPNSSSAEEGPDATFDFLANGLKIRGNYSTLNASGGTYIYLCFAEQPFKYSNAR